jgi:hypothetical protein
MVNVNNLIANIENIVAESTEESDQLDIYKGEAYFLRAFYYYQLVLRFSSDYEPATSSSDMGVPLVLEFNVNLLPSRSSMEDTYQQILDDIASAKDLLSDITGSQNSNYITGDCVLALEAQVRLSMHQYSQSAQIADDLISSGRYPLINDASEFKSMWENDISTEVIFQFPLSAPNELGNVNNIYLGYKPDLDKYTPDFVPQQWIIDQYEDTDIRKNVYLEPKLLEVQGAEYPDIWCINKYPGNPDLFVTATTNYQQMPKVFRIAEMYLISAEASAQTPSSEADALAALNELRTARGISALSGISGTALMDEIKAERTREFLCEGKRLDDLKRWHMGFARSAPQNINLIETGVNFDQKVVAADADKFVWAIPANDITTNPNIADQQNPGW